MTSSASDIILEKHEEWTRQNPIWRVLFPVSMPNEKILVPGLDLPVRTEYTIASVTVVGKADAEKVAARLKTMLKEQNDAEDA